MSHIEARLIHVIGLGVAQYATLSAQASDALLSSDAIIGSKRQIDTIAHLVHAADVKPEIIAMPKLAQLKLLLAEYSGQAITVLASGDPLYYGVGRWLAQHVDKKRLRFYPAVSSIQAACHELGLSIQDVEVLSLHGRPIEKLRTCLQANKKLVVLTDQYSQPTALARECMAAGFDQSTLTVCENLGYDNQCVRQFTVQQLVDSAALHVDPLHITVIELSGAGGVFPEFPGIADTAYMTGAEPGKGMISKREVRLVILSLLQPAHKDIVWDVGAGCGGVTVELAYWNKTITVHAIEYHQQRLQYLSDNCHRFGVSQQVNIVSGRAPDICSHLPSPNKIFVGGSDGKMAQLLPALWERLPLGGVLVVSAVMGSSKEVLKGFAQTAHNSFVESVEVAIKRGDIHGEQLRYQEKLPVEIFKFVKTSYE